MRRGKPGGAGDMRPRRLQDFEGVRRFDRQIAHADGGRAAVTGRALWRPEGGRLILDETGEMRLPGHAPIPVSRRYLWEPGLLVRFADGRPFHRVPPEGGATVHRCDPDRYEGRYDFSDWPGFTLVWKVRGPRKHYRMVTRYAPPCPGGPA